MDKTDKLTDIEASPYTGSIKPENKRNWLDYVLLSVYITPLLVITYLYIQYIYPMLSTTGSEQDALGISAVLTLAVVLSILGMLHLAQMARKSVDSLTTMNTNMDNLLTMTRHFEESKYVDILVDDVARSAKVMLKAEASSLLLFDNDGELRFEYVEGPAADKLKGMAVKLGEGIAGWVAKEGVPLIVNDVRNDKRFAKAFDNQSGFITRSILCVPLTFSGKNLGVLEIINKTDSGFTEGDIEMLSVLAGHASAAIHRNKATEDIHSDFVQVTDLLVASMDGLMPEKRGHSKRVARYSVALAKELGLSSEDTREIYFGALLHDVGMLRISIEDHVKEEKYKLHPGIGSDIVRKVNQWRHVAGMIHDHHERYDGNGYPSGLAGRDISLGGRIIGLAEAFDVMTCSSTNCNYKIPFSFEEAMEEVKACSGTQFDPELVELILNSFTIEDVQEV